MEIDFTVAFLTLAIFAIAFVGASIGNWMSARELKRIKAIVEYAEDVYDQKYEKKQSEIKCPTCGTWQYAEELDSERYNIKVHVCDNDQCKRLLPLDAWKKDN